MLDYFNLVLAKRSYTYSKLCHQLKKALLFSSGERGADSNAAALAEIFAEETKKEKC